MQQTMDVKVENKNYLEKEFNLLQTVNNDFFEFIQEALLDGIWYLNIENNGNQWFSPKLWSILGYRSVEVKYSIEDWNSIIHPEDLQLLTAKIQKNLKKPKKTLNLTVRFFHKDGSIVWFNCFGKLLPTETDNPNRLVIVLKNITDLKLLENKFLKIEETFVEMNKVAKIGHWELDVIENELFWSDYCKVIYDVSKDYVPDIFNAISFFEEGESRDRITRLLEICSKNGTPWDEELQIVTDNKSKWVRVIGNAIFEEGVCKKIFGVIQDISKRKAQTFALTISQNQFKQIFDHAKVGMCMLDFEGNFLEVNKSMCQILGYTREEFLKLKDSSITHPKYVAFCEQKTEELISGAIDSYQMEKSYFHKNGQPVCVTISAPVVRNSKNEPQFIIKEVQDITERKNSEKNLQESETKFRNIVENANDIIFISNLSGEFIYLSPNLEEKIGYNLEDLIGNSFLKIVHPDYLEFTIGALQKVVTTKEKQLSDDFIILHKNGNKLWYQANGTPLFDENNEVYAVLGIGRDITDFKISEEALLKSVAEVTLTAKRYKSLLDNDSVYIIKVDLNGNYSFVNNHFCRQFGFDQSVIGTSSLQGIIEDDHVLCIDTVTKCFLEPEVSHQVVLRKIMSDKAIGGSKWEFKGILDDEGHVKEILCVGIDITNEVRSLEKAENLLTLTAKQNVQLKSFNYIVSHDIRSHAANIKALVELIPSITDDEERETVFEMLNLSSKKLSETLDNLNQIISISENTFKHYSEVKLLDEINKTLEIFSYQIKESDVTFLLNIDKNLTLNLVKAYLDSILLNLISNAIKYQSNKRSLIVTITASKTDNGTEVKISDNGRGFDFEKFKSKVFGMYKTFHSGEDSRGFGLYITKSQIEVMGGTISVESEIDIGTTFTLNFS